MFNKLTVYEINEGLCTVTIENRPNRKPDLVWIKTEDGEIGLNKKEARSLVAVLEDLDKDIEDFA